MCAFFLTCPIGVSVESSGIDAVDNKAKLGTTVLEIVGVCLDLAAELGLNVTLDHFTRRVEGSSRHQGGDGKDENGEELHDDGVVSDGVFRRESTCVCL